MSTNRATAHAALDPGVLARIDGLDLRARMLVEGMMSGRHRSPYRGFSVEFVEHRRYSQGDDLKFLDWKVFGRSDKYYVKQYEQESNLQLMLAMDGSESMSYRGNPRGMSKYEYGATVAAALAYLTLQQADAVGLVRFDETPGRVHRASTNPAQFHALVHDLEAEPSGKKTRIANVLDILAEQLVRRHLVILISDLFDDAGAILRGLRHLRHRRHEAIVFQVLDHAEVEFPFTQLTRFRGLEGCEPLLTEPRAVRSRYLAEVRAFLDRMRSGCHELKADFCVFDTSEPLEASLSAYLATRAARSA